MQKINNTDCHNYTACKYISVIYQSQQVIAEYTELFVHKLKSPGLNVAWWITSCRATENGGGGELS
jgi:hypothetical protein